MTLQPRERSRRELVITAPAGTAGAGAHEITGPGRAPVRRRPSS